MLRILREPDGFTDNGKKFESFCWKFTNRIICTRKAPKKQKARRKRAFEGRKLHGHCAVGHRTLSSTAV
jgi:hypothetical protein